MKQSLIALALILGVAAFVGQHPAQAGGFNMNLIITDDEFTDANSMSASKIQEFLNGQSGILKNYKTADFEGNQKTAAEIIYNSAQAYKISPRVLLTTLQKEESLLTMTNPSQTRLDYAMGYGCPDGGYQGSACNVARAGFGKQVDLAGWQFRRYLDRIAQVGYSNAYKRADGSIAYWGPTLANPITCISSDASRGLCTNGSTITITPANAATAALYTYTPHPGGNYSFWTIWNQYSFGVRLTYPDGTLLQPSGTKDIYLIQGGKKRKFASMSAFLSRYSAGNVITVSKDQLFFYDAGLPIKYANYSLLQKPAGGIFLLVDDTVRPIPTRAAFKAAGFIGAEVIKVKEADLAVFPRGPAITTENIYPSGRLMQDRSTGAVWFVKDGLRSAVPSRSIFKSQFGIRKPVTVSAKTLAKYSQGPNVGFKDGELVRAKGSDQVYFISNGQRLPIASYAAAQAYKFDLIWKNIIVTDERSLAIHPIGPTLDVPAPAVQLASQ